MERRSDKPLPNKSDGPRSISLSSIRENEIMIWVDLFTEYVMDKTIIIRTAQTIVEGYEECHSAALRLRGNP